MQGKALNEVDVVRIVGSKYAKANAGDDRKAVMKAEFRVVYRVWSTFLKLLNNQVHTKLKMIDTLYIGHFFQNNVGQVEFLVAPDFWEAGKFKGKVDFNKQNELIKVNHYLLFSNNG